MTRRHERIVRKRALRRLALRPSAFNAWAWGNAWAQRFNVGHEPAPAAVSAAATGEVPLNDEHQVESEPSPAPERVLAVFPDSSVLKQIRESIGACTTATVDTTPNATFAFELAMQRDYQLYFFGVEMPVLGGEHLYDFVAKAFAQNRPEPRVAPGVVYITTADAWNLPVGLRRDARVRDVFSCPFDSERLLKCTEDILTRKESL